jgi:hypothetical protein
MRPWLLGMVVHVLVMCVVGCSESTRTPFPTSSEKFALESGNQPKPIAAAEQTVDGWQVVVQSLTATKTDGAVEVSLRIIPPKPPPAAGAVPFKKVVLEANSSTMFRLGTPLVKTVDMTEQAFSYDPLTNCYSVLIQDMYDSDWQRRSSVSLRPGLHTIHVLVTIDALKMELPDLRLRVVP